MHVDVGARSAHQHEALSQGGGRRGKAGRAVPAIDLRTETRALVCGLLTTPWGRVSPSVYETGRLVTLAPWLRGHQKRLDYLLAEQREDGAWGGPGGYAIVPTLSAVEALLSAGGATPGPGGAALLDAAERGLRRLARLLPDIDAAAVPDMPALDLITTSLIVSINRLLDEWPATAPGPAFDGRLRAPDGVDGTRLTMVRAAVDEGARPPTKVLHALEVLGTAARGHAAITPEATGTVGASAAATAAWLDENSTLDSHIRAKRFLEKVVDGHHGLAPCGIPITIFERSWVLGGLARAGLDLTVPRPIMDDFAACIGPAGIAAAAGLPADADTTSVTLYTLGRLGIPCTPDSLWAFETETHFCTWPGEQALSVTTNAHVLDALGAHLRAGARSERATAAVQKIIELLCERQRADGGWLDRWHASPYYATMCCALALHDYGGEAAADTVTRARDGLLAAQRDDGSWGLWAGTAEETAYSLQTLALTGPVQPEVQESITRGYEFLLCAVADPDEAEIAAPALWHDKDLYHPRAIVRAAVLGALHLADTSRTPTGGRSARQ
ncbi:prenyltransferase/squalene oxidase repeat-containing protein [Actinomadura roseirufa]|uniref:prenyltransferase/squalene oxidase repeat-containing protein n=1 Tax=Actinomadura roseirufa TaxID=2094049 RepID=UPI001040F1D6|nr:prenyltransferase/squalene oxidase repeat-containing protein [Actinomadura roseirufa]